MFTIIKVEQIVLTEQNIYKKLSN